MLKNTFIHIRGVGVKTERRLWRDGFLTWDDLLKDPGRLNLPPLLKERSLAVVRKSQESLTNEKPVYFAEVLPRSESWRLYREFKDNAAYIDIETDGTWSADAVTLIGLYDGREYKSFLKGYDLAKAEGELSRYLLWITYGGTGFDLPLIYVLFPRLRGKHLHIDLRFPLRRLGLKGGLKKIEQLRGIERSSETRGLDGWDAVRLWKEHRNGSAGSLDLLTKYNREDCINLKPLIEFAYSRLYQHTFKRYLCYRTPANRRSKIK